VITLGIDLASQPELTAICEIVWDHGRALVTEIRADVDNTRLRNQLDSSRFHKIGIDIPLGWPEKFLAAMTEHHSAGSWPDCPLNALRYRATDEFVNQRLGTHVLSVSSDRIAIPAFRAAKLAAELSAPIDRAGGGRICEVYPAGALCRWGLPHRGYKGKKKLGVRGKLLEALLRKAEPWLHIDDPNRSFCESNDNALDALVACLVARAAACGLVDGIPSDLRERASREGWIALPAPESLDRLAQSTAL
jgi:hypothetical protein